MISLGTNTRDHYTHTILFISLKSILKSERKVDNSQVMLNVPMRFFSASLRAMVYLQLTGSGTHLGRGSV